MKRLSKNKEQEKTGRSFSLFKEPEETEEEQKKRKIYERINSDGYYNVIYPLDYDKKVEKNKLTVSKTKIYVALAIFGSLAIAVIGLMSLLK